MDQSHQGFRYQAAISRPQSRSSRERCRVIAVGSGPGAFGDGCRRTRVLVVTGADGRWRSSHRCAASVSGRLLRSAALGQGRDLPFDAVFQPHRARVSAGRRRHHGVDAASRRGTTYAARQCPCLAVAGGVARRGPRRNGAGRAGQCRLALGHTAVAWGCG